MLKHVHISPVRSRSDNMSLKSACTSLCGSPEPVLRSPSRSSSYSSLDEIQTQTPIKIYTGCLGLDIEYKTTRITWDTTSSDVIIGILRRCKLRHLDPHDFYLSMEITVRPVGIRTVLMLDNDSKPAILHACHPRGDLRFCLQRKPEGLITETNNQINRSIVYALNQLLVDTYKCQKEERLNAWELEFKNTKRRRLSKYLQNSER